MYFSPRYRELSAPSADVKRIHVIGDSIIYGTGVNSEEALPCQLEEALHQDFPEDLFVCMNIAHESRDMWNGLILYKAMFPKAQCDLLVFSVCDNDNEWMCALGVDYTKDPSKHTYWKDAFLKGLAERCLIELKEYSQREKVPLLVLFYENFIEDFVVVGETLDELCAKHDIPFLNLTKHHAEMYSLSAEEGRVSKADGHPSARFHNLAGRILSNHIKKTGLLCLHGHEQSVFDRMNVAVQEMLDFPFSPQDIYAWADRAIRVKSAALSRRMTDRAKRQLISGQFESFSSCIRKSWVMWQREKWDEGCRARLLIEIHKNYDQFYELKHLFVYFSEAVLALQWCEEKGNFDQACEFLQPILEHFSHAPYRLPPAFDRPFGYANAPQLPEILGCLRNAACSMDQFYKHFVEIERRSYHGDAVFLINFLHDLGALAHSLADDLAALMTAPAYLSRADRKLENFFYQSARDLTLYLHYFVQMLERHIHGLSIKSPIAGIDLFVTITIDHPSSQHFIGNGLFVYCAPINPAGIIMHADTHHLDGMEKDYTYRLRLPFFSQANLRLIIYGCDTEKYGIGIIKLALLPALIGQEDYDGPAHVIEFDQKQRKIYLNDIVITI